MSVSRPSFAFEHQCGVCLTYVGEHPDEPGFTPARCCFGCGCEVEQPCPDCGGSGTVVQKVGQPVREVPVPCPRGCGGNR